MPELLEQKRGLSPGDWLNTFTGKKFFPLRPQPADVDILDIAHALACVCRFAGHVREFYSVAQHSVLVSTVVPPELALWGLLHDASEAYLGDVPRPLKRRPEFVFYKTAERRLMGAVCMRFDLPLQEPPEVKEADNRVLYTEARDLFDRRNPEWNNYAEPYEHLVIKPLPPASAERLFLMRFLQLTKRAS